MRWLIDDEADGDDGIVAAVVMMMVLVVARVIATVAMTVLTVLVGGGAGVDGNGGWRYGTDGDDGGAGSGDGGDVGCWRRCRSPCRVPRWQCEVLGMTGHYRCQFWRGWRTAGWLAMRRRAVVWLLSAHLSDRSPPVDKSTHESRLYLPEAFHLYLWPVG